MCVCSITHLKVGVVGLTLPAELDDVLKGEDHSKLTRELLVMAPSQTWNHKYLVTLVLLRVWQ